MMTNRLRPFLSKTSLGLLTIWHGLFAGAYVTAFVTAEATTSLHIAAGYLAAGLLAIRLAVGLVAPPKGFWSMPWAPAAAWRTFLRRLFENPVNALSARTPFVPVSALAILGTSILAILSGLMADAWRAEDLHEGLSNLSLVAVGVHVALVSVAPALRQLSKGTVAAENIPSR